MTKKIQHGIDGIEESQRSVESTLKRKIEKKTKENLMKKSVKKNALLKVDLNLDRWWTTKVRWKP